jgi:glycosyltransferase involved in cell wall biosynthesis
VADKSEFFPSQATERKYSSRVLDGRYSENRYLTAFPDVAAAVKSGDFPSGLAHFLYIGRTEMLAGRRLVPAFFDDDLLAIVEHAPGRPCRLDFGNAPGDFDEALYLALLPDVALAMAKGDVRSALEHWLECGFAELASGRRRLGFVPPTSQAIPTIRDVEWGEAERRMTFPDALPQPGAPRGLSVPQFRTLRFERLMARPFGVNVFGPFAMESGLGTIARGMLAALQAAGIAVDLWPYDTAQGWQTMPKTGLAPRYRINLLLVNADTVQYLLAAFPLGTFDDAYSVALWQWELASIRPDVMLSLSDVDEIWTSSSFEKSAIAAIVPVPVLVVPPPVRVRPALDGERWNIPGINDNTFVFITILDMASRLQRKNSMAAVEAFAELNAPETVLLVKLHGTDPQPANIAMLHQMATRHSCVIVLDEVFTEPEMVRLRARADCLLSPHRSEGFGLNIAEFLALGKSVVATSYSGNADFFDAAVGYPIEYDLVELAAAVPPYPAGYVWAEPRHSSLVAQMREVMEDADKRRLLAEAASARMAESYTASRAGQVIAARFHELGLGVPQPPFMSVANGAQRILARKAANGGAFVGSAFSVPLVVNEAAEGTAALAALLAQTHGGWELLVRPGNAAKPDVQAWLEAMLGSSPRVRVLSREGPGLIEAATCAFVLFAADADALGPVVLAEASAVLAAEPACDAVVRLNVLLAVRKSLLLAMGEYDLPPDRALTPAFAKRLANHTRLLRRLS